MKIAKVIDIKDNQIVFDNGYKLYSDHEQDCCEVHYLDFEHVKVEDFDGLIFDFRDYKEEKFFERVKDYGIRLKPTNGHPVSIPGYAGNNGYYSNQLTLILDLGNGKEHTYNITECQEDKWGIDEELWDDEDEQTN